MKNLRGIYTLHLTLPAYPASAQNLDDNISAGQLAGIVTGVSASALLSAASVWYYRKNKKLEEKQMSADSDFCFAQRIWTGLGAGFFGCGTVDFSHSNESFVSAIKKIETELGNQGLQVILLKNKPYELAELVDCTVSRIKELGVMSYGFFKRRVDSQTITDNASTIAEKVFSNFRRHHDIPKYKEGDIVKLSIV